MSEPLITRQQMIQALHRVGEKLLARGKRADVFVFGGATMVLAFQARPATRDIDAVYEPDTEVHEAAVEVAAEMGIPRHGLNNQASDYLPPQHGAGAAVLDEPGIRVMAAAADLVLAMKLGSARGARDAEDIDWLLRELDISRLDDAEAVYRRFFPETPLSERALLIVEDLLRLRL